MTLHHHHLHHLHHHHHHHNDENYKICGQGDWLLFSEKSEKMVSYWLIGPYYNVFLRELTFLDQYGLYSGWFFMKILKKWHSNTVLLREWTFFWQNIDLRAVCFLEIGRFFTHKSDDFFVINRKKRASYWLLWLII